ncbi:MAG: pyruvate dehydrogenase (acetyl-transferring) E1 component subunit alpha [Spirochaetales bacterium]|nr:pyruvate dehydrogenase (acetyl-transferring) E1 component subunit alpha [Spirochaetales bacterium]
MSGKLEKQYGKKLLEKLYREMVLIRRFEEVAGQQYGLRKIGGFCHLYIGQEAVAVGSIAALDLEKDYVVTAYRDHGHALACGMEPDVIMAELFGKVTGCSGGKGGSMHLFDAGRHMLGGNGIVGAHIPIATGVALKLKTGNEKGVVLCYFGDGAIHQGSFHESMNLAKILGLPIIYICENNQYGMGTDFTRVSSQQDLSVLGTAYNIPGKQLNGMDVLEVYDGIQKAVATVRETSDPLFFEIKTYRYRGHSMSDPAKYRTKEELDNYKQQDPILILKKRLVDEQVFAENKLDEIDEEAKRSSAQSVKFAEESAEPSIESLYSDVYA